MRSYAGDGAVAYKYQAGVTFDKFKKDYDTVFAAYKNLPPNAHSDQIKTVLRETQNLLEELSNALTGTYNAIDFINQRITDTKPPQIAADKTDLGSYITKVNSDLSAVQTAITNIENAKDSATTDELNLKSAELAVSQAHDNYINAQKDLANTVIRAPFDGTVAAVPVESGDDVTTGTTVATMITKDKVADISLNEIDVSKVQVGQKATLTFDAINGLTATGEVTEVGLLGTVSQGVVNYTVKINLDNPDPRIKSGMSVTASIVTDSVQSVISVPTSAIKTQRDGSYVEILDNVQTNSRGPVTSATPPRLVKVTLGLSNDDSTQITSGLNEGDKYVVSTIAAASGPSSSQAPSLFGGGIRTNSGGNRNGANAGAFFRATGGGRGR
jgi:RND family efflux transporter MFP subunit